MAFLFETKSNGVTRKYFQAEGYIVPFIAPEEELGKVYSFYGGLDTPLDSLQGIDLVAVVRRNVNVGDRLVVRELDGERELETGTLHGEVTAISTYYDYTEFCE